MSAPANSSASASATATATAAEAPSASLVSGHISDAMLRVLAIMANMEALKPALPLMLRHIATTERERLALANEHKASIQSLQRTLHVRDSALAGSRKLSAQRQSRVDALSGEIAEIKAKAAEETAALNREKDRLAAAVTHLEMVNRSLAQDNSRKTGVITALAVKYKKLAGTKRPRAIGFQHRNLTIEIPVASSSAPVHPSPSTSPSPMFPGEPTTPTSPTPKTRSCPPKPSSRARKPRVPPPSPLLDTVPPTTPETALPLHLTTTTTTTTTTTVGEIFPWANQTAEGSLPLSPLFDTDLLLPKGAIECSFDITGHDSMCVSSTISDCSAVEGPHKKQKTDSSADPLLPLASSYEAPPTATTTDFAAELLFGV